jgi:hypothetical protein
MSTEVIPSPGELLAQALLGPTYEWTKQRQVFRLTDDEFHLNAAVVGEAIVTTRHINSKAIHIERRAWSIWRRTPELELVRTAAVTWCWQLIRSARRTKWLLDGHRCKTCFRLYAEAGYELAIPSHALEF